MHHVTKLAEAELRTPARYADGSDGYRRASHVDRSVGAVHTGFGTCEVAGGGRIGTHVHSYEEFVYVTAGHPILRIGDTATRLAPDEGVFIGVGEPHSWANDGDEACRWIDLEAPQARGDDEPPDTFFVAGGEDEAEVREFDPRDPLLRRYCRWQPTQMDLDHLKQPSAVDAPAESASMSSALLAYAGITVKMLLDERHGATLGNVFMVDYYPGVVLHPHDHPFEEAFYMLEGEVVYIADGEEYTLTAGSVAYAGVGCIHAFENRTDVRCRWLETRAPAPPARHAYRFERDWATLRENGA
jgi:quercetin dioxygenase-like cupin family protein